MDTARAITSIGTISAALYAVVYVAQRQLSHLDARGSSTSPLAAYILATITLFVLYGAAAVAASRASLRSRERLLLLFFPIVFSTALTIGRPYLSIDVFTYAAQGHQALSGENPYAHPVKTIAGTRLGRDLAAQGWIPVHGVSPYGPLWTEIEAAVAGAASNVATEAMYFKLIVTAFSLGCGWMIWLILGDVLPRAQTLGTVLYLWNPAILMEFAAEGHNDAVLVFFVLLSLRLVLRARPAIGVASLAVGALVKATAVIVAPVELVYAWRTTRDRRRLLMALAVGAGSAAVIGVAAYAPLWIGSATFDGLRNHGRPSILPSTPGVLYWYLTRSHSEERSALLLSLLMTGAFLGSVALAAATVKSRTSLLKACGYIAVVYLIVAPGYWPWYAGMPIALLALVPDAMFVSSLMAISLASRLAAPIDALRLRGIIDWEAEVIIQTIVGVWAPAGVIALVAVRAAGRRATTTCPAPVVTGY
jgi:alpha-1,6-mannosyltransferase